MSISSQDYASQALPAGYHSIGRRRCRGRVCFIGTRGDTEDQRADRGDGGRPVRGRGGLRSRSF